MPKSKHGTYDYIREPVGRVVLELGSPTDVSTKNSAVPEPRKNPGDPCGQDSNFGWTPVGVETSSCLKDNVGTLVI